MVFAPDMDFLRTDHNCNKPLVDLAEMFEQCRLFGGGLRPAKQDRRRAGAGVIEQVSSIDDVHEDFPALAIDLVVALRGKEIETFRTDCLHEGVAAAGQDDNTVIAVGADRVKQVHELFVGISVEGQRAAIGVKRHFQHAGF